MGDVFALIAVTRTATKEGRRTPRYREAQACFVGGGGPAGPSRFSRDQPCRRLSLQSVHPLNHPSQGFVTMLPSNRALDGGER